MLTRFARFSLEYVQERAALAVELAGSGMSAEEREVFYRCLELITTNLQSLSKEGLPQTMSVFAKSYCISSCDK